MIISTAPWYCEGDFYVPNPWEQHDNRETNPTWSSKIISSRRTDRTCIIERCTTPAYKYRVIGVPKGSSHLKYAANRPLW
ncbi:MAG: hypothetical protein IPN89_10885 [Saprospiraceae bacterium]|nr:hypothetical protein [Saprospiraceae bacterium]